MPMRATLLHAGARESVLNAMLMGKPVVLPDTEGGADYIESGAEFAAVAVANRAEQAAACGSRAEGVVVVRRIVFVRGITVAGGGLRSQPRLRP